MSLFKRKEKMDLDTVSGMVFFASFLTKGKIAEMELEGIDTNHEMVVRTGYIFGLSITMISSKIGVKNINKFVDLAIKNAKETLNKDTVTLIPEFEKYMKKATNLVVNESLKYGNKVFERYATLYLNDLYDGSDYPRDMLNIAIQDMVFYFENWKNMGSGLKIIK